MVRLFSTLLILLQSSNAGEQNMEEIFIYVSKSDSPIVVLAAEATKYTDSNNESIYLRLKDGVAL
ncbi:MAG: hypothetical protein ACJ0HV_04695 [Candidatus Pseudothioglobus sp.]